MTRTSVLAVCSATFFAGLWLGARGELTTLTRSAHAGGRDAVGADNAYNELRSRTSPLQEGSDLLAKIARLTTNSVVHIQSERRKAKGGLVEETGSGVIVES